MPNENPCFRCEHHAAGCHDDCRAYKDWQERHIAEYRRRRTEQERSNALRSYCIEGVSRRKKRRER